jgi:hypothetical protein
MNKKNKNFLIVLGIIAFIVVMIVWGRFLNDGAPGSFWFDTNIECLSQGHQNLAFHFHPNLKIFVDEEEQFIPANVGISHTCMAEVHTHEPDGVLHVESVRLGKEFVLQDFFTVWQESLIKEGFELVMTVDGEQSDELGNLVLSDEQNIVLEYRSVDSDI